MVVEHSVTEVVLFCVLIIVCLWCDLHAHQADKPVSARNAAIWSCIWVGLALVFAGYIGYSFGSEQVQLFLTGYLLEKSLSVDNLFVIMAIFSSFAVKDAFQHRVLYYGVLGALVLRLIFVAAGSSLVAMFGPYALASFGIFVLWTAWKMWQSMHSGEKEEIVDYSEHWATRDYTLDAENIKCPALIVHGLNDDNVRTKEFDLMYQAYQKAGVNVKLLLHQDAHLTPSYPAGNLEFYIDGESYNNVLNRWFSHYLCGVENGAENMAAVTAQSNVDASVWNTYDSWTTDESIALSNADDTGTTTINSDYATQGINRRNWRDALTAGSTDVSAMYTMDVDADTVIKGSVAVSFTASADNYDAPETTSPRGTVDHDNYVGEETNALDHDNYVGAASADGAVTVSLPDGADLIDRDALMVSAMLVDIAPEGTTFPAYNTQGSYVPKTITAGGAWMGGGLNNYDYAELNATDVSYKIIARGWMDLCNPGAGYDSASAGTKVALKVGENHDYTIYLQPNLYTVKEGHKLALVIYTYEPGKANYSQDYQITLENASVSAEIPVDKIPAVPALPFTDVPADTELYAAVKWAYFSAPQITVGVTETTFAPASTCTRAEVVTFLYRLAGEPDVSGTALPFTDVAEDAYYTDAVKWAAANGVTAGTSATTFSPNDTCTRAQAVTLLYNAAGAPAVSDTVSFADVAADAYYADAVAWAAANGVTVGTSATTFSPDDACTRGQIVCMLYRGDTQA